MASSMTAVNCGSSATSRISWLVAIKIIGMACALLCRVAGKTFGGTVAASSGRVCGSRCRSTVMVKTRRARFQAASSPDARAYWAQAMAANVSLNR